MLGLALLLVSCEKEKIPTTINEVTDLYTAPAGAVEMSSLSKAESVWSLDRRYFNLDFGALTTTLVGYDALLAPGQYVLGNDEIGKAILSKTKVNGSQPSEGFITVNRDANGTYYISATVDGAVYAWNGSLPFKADPAATVLSVLQQAQSNVANGTNSVTMQLATDGISQSMDWTTWQTVWTGEGGYLALDLYSDDGYLHEGVYTPCAVGGVINPGEFGIGYDTTMQWGDQVYEMKDWGTCWWAVSGGAAVASKITGGIITVTKLEGDKAWRIAWGEKYPVEYIFEGDIAALTKPKKPETATFDYSYTEELGDPSDGVVKHTITIVDKNENEMAHLELLMADGESDYSGSYPSTSYASQAGQMADGWEIPDWNMGGGSYFIDHDGNKVLMKADEWTVVVTKLAKGAYKFSWEGYEYSAAGPDYVPEEGGGNDGPVLDMEDTVAVDCTDAANTLYEDVESHTLVLKEGETFVAQIKLVRKVGTTDLSGDYTVGEYAHEDLIAANGFDLGAMFGMDPGAWVIGSYYVQDGTIKIIEPGETIKVTSVGDKTYKFVGSTGYTFVGKLK